MISLDVLIPLFAAFVVSVVLSPFVIPFLQKLKIGQTERSEGVQSHLKKAGTPTMGGLIILISIVVYRKISENDSGAVSGAWFWDYRFS